MDLIQIAYAAEEAAHQAVENKGFVEALGINWKIFIAQIINFAVVLLVLAKWVYKPLTSALNERSAKIEKSLADAKKIESDLKKLEETKAQEIARVKKEAQEIINEAHDKSEKNRQFLLQETTQKANTIIQEAKERLEDEKQKMRQEIKEEVTDLVVALTTKVLSKTVDEKIDKKIVESIVGDFNKKS